jgi:hypothetical protein
MTANITHADDSTTTINGAGYIGGSQSDVSGSAAFTWTGYTGQTQPAVDPLVVTRIVVLEATAATPAVGISSIKYQAIHDGQPYGTGHTAPSVLYVLKGSSVLFHAIANPVGATFPATGLVWSGSSGATGTAATTTVTFSTVSASTTDYKTVTATYNGSSVTVNVIVYTLTPNLVYSKEFGPSGIMHDPDRLGIGEVVNLSYTVAPSGVELPDSMQWTDHQADKDPLTGPLPTFVAPTQSDSDVISLTLESGPSAGSAVQLKQEVIIPTGISQIPRHEPGKPEIIYHDGKGAAAPAGAPLPSAGSLRWDCLLPVNVSWANVQTSENDCLPVVYTGTCASAWNIYHELGTTKKLGSLLWHKYAYVPADNAWESDQVDIVDLLVHEVNPGEVTYDITINVQTSWDTQRPIYGDKSKLSMTQDMKEDAYGSVTLSKGGFTTVAPLEINGVDTPYVGPFPDLSNGMGKLPNKW